VGSCRRRGRGSSAGCESTSRSWRSALSNRVGAEKAHRARDAESRKPGGRGPYFRVSCSFESLNLLEVADGASNLIRWWRRRESKTTGAHLEVRNSIKTARSADAASAIVPDSASKCATFRGPGSSTHGTNATRCSSRAALTRAVPGAVLDVLEMKRPSRSLAFATLARCGWRELQPVGATHGRNRDRRAFRCRGAATTWSVRP